MNQCNDPDHGAINAERTESKGLRKAWVELDDKRQVLERQRDKLAEALRKIKNANGSYDDPFDELDFIDGVIFEALQSLNQPNNA